MRDDGTTSADGTKTPSKRRRLIAVEDGSGCSAAPGAPSGVGAGVLAAIGALAVLRRKRR